MFATKRGPTSPFFSTQTHVKLYSVIEALIVLGCLDLNKSIKFLEIFNAVKT
jgi:hypothetical protein